MIREPFHNYKGYHIWRNVELLDGYVSFSVIINGQEYEYTDILRVQQEIDDAINQKTKTNQRG